MNLSPWLRSSGFSLLELLSGVTIMAVLVAAMTPVAGSLMGRAAMVDDTAKMRSYGAALSSMIAERNAVSAGEILRSGSTIIDDYAGGADAAIKMLNSSTWTKKIQSAAAAAGQAAGSRMRSYTLNDALFPPMAQQPGQPPPAPWEIDSVSSTKLRERSDRPLLFTGVFFAGHSGAYVWGGRSHANPIYDRVDKPRVTSSIQGTTMVLFVGGHVRAVDFSKENLPSADGKADPEGWWKRNF